MQSWGAWRSRDASAATAVSSMSNALADRKSVLMKAMTSTTIKVTVPAIGSSQAAKPADPPVNLSTLIMNWRRRNAEEVNGTIYPDWETKQQPPSYVWSMADANFHLPSNETLQEPIHRLVRPRPTSPLLTRPTPPPRTVRRREEAHEAMGRPRPPATHAWMAPCMVSENCAARELTQESPEKTPRSTPQDPPPSTPRSHPRAHPGATREHTQEPPLISSTALHPFALISIPAL